MLSPRLEPPHSDLRDSPRMVRAAPLNEAGVRVLPVSLELERGSKQVGRLIDVASPLATAGEARHAYDSAAGKTRARRVRALSAYYEIEGPLAARDIVARAGLSLPPRMRNSLSAGISVSVRIWAAADGAATGGFTVTRTSGYADVDKLVAQTLRGWKFAPLPASSGEQWGTVTVTFEGR
ncbi:MAG: TonB family protein [Elusimicrobiales bacterium]